MTVIVKLLRFFIVLFAPLYGFWSRLWRAILDRKYKNVSIPSNWSPLFLSRWLHYVEYRADGAINYSQTPQRTWFTRKGNCNDSATLAAAVIDPTYNPKLLSVQWFGPLGIKDIHGHMVCILEKDNKLYHIGNWGLWGPYDTDTELLHSIVQDGDLIAFTWYDKDLRYIGTRKSK